MDSSILDSRTDVAAHDSQNVLHSIETLAGQIEHAWQSASRMKIPSKYKAIKNIVVAGMGGSGLGAHLIAASLPIKKPFHIVNDYTLPEHVGADSLVVLSSYSGNTEETLRCASNAQKRKAKIAAITAGGELKILAEKNGWPLGAIDPSDNPSNQPRLSTGASTFILLGLLKTLGFTTITDANVERIASRLREEDKRLAVEMRRNVAKRLAAAAEKSFLIFIGAEHLYGAAHVVSNQVNENAKQLSIFLPLPELDHHFLEALSFPRQTKRDLLAILFQSGRLHPRNGRRVALTADLLGRNGVRNEIVKIEGASPLEEACLAVQLGSYLSFYLAVLHNIDPGPVPNVESFKNAL